MSVFAPAVKSSERLIAASASLAVGVVIGAAIGVSILYGVVLAVLLVATALLLVVRRDLFPAIALIAYVFVPVKFFPVLGEGGAPLNPGLMVILVWALRMFFGGRSDVPIRVTLGVLTVVSALAFWMLLGFARYRGVESVPGFVISFLFLVLVPACLMRSEPNAKATVIKVWRDLATGLGIYAVIETKILHQNVLYGWLYSSGPSPLEQAWSVYRATTTLGHPLVNAAFFTVGVALALDVAIRERSARNWLALGAIVLGLMSTGSRGGFLSAGVAIALVLFQHASASASTSRQRSKAFFAMLGCLLLMAPVYLQVSERSGTSEGQGSAEYRATAFSLAMDMAGDYWLWGVGPGNADEFIRSPATSDHGFENSWVEIFVGTGVIGFVLFATLFVMAIRASWRKRDFGLTGGLAAYGVIAFTFNLVEGNWPALILLGLLLGCAFSKETASVCDDKRESTVMANVTS